MGGKNGIVWPTLQLVSLYIITIINPLTIHHHYEPLMITNHGKNGIVWPTDSPASPSFHGVGTSMSRYAMSCSDSGTGSSAAPQHLPRNSRTSGVSASGTEMFGCPGVPQHLHDQVLPWKKWVNFWGLPHFSTMFWNRLSWRGSNPLEISIFPWTAAKVPQCPTAPCVPGLASLACCGPQASSRKSPGSKMFPIKTAIFWWISQWCSMFPIKKKFGVLAMSCQSFHPKWYGWSHWGSMPHASCQVWAPSSKRCAKKTALFCICTFWLHDYVGNKSRKKSDLSLKHAQIISCASHQKWSKMRWESPGRSSRWSRWYLPDTD